MTAPRRRLVRPSLLGGAVLRAASAAVAIVTGGLLAGCGRPRALPGRMTEPHLSATALLGGGSELAGFDRAWAPIPLELPRDYGPHPRFRDEWWYFTGILQSAGASSPHRRFGYQLTIFRQGLQPHAPGRASAWATANLYMAHLAIADLDGDPQRPRFHAYQRFARDGMGLAGARAAPFEVWVYDWRAAGPAKTAKTFPVTLRALAAIGDQPNGAADLGSIPVASLELSVGAGRGPILQGDRGLSQKGPHAGEASYYHSFTRLPTQGTITLAGQSFTVSGWSWLDREWSTGALGATVIGWDWLGVQLNDGRDVMVYRLRTTAGVDASQSRATLIDPDGQTHLFAPGAFTLTPIGQWQSRDGRARYPAAMGLRIPAAAVDLTIRPLLADQELMLAIRYWEGAVDVTGGEAGHAVTGDGYLELTGYEAAPDP